MKMRIREFAQLTGVSIRTLHYYDEIGLLKPSFLDKQSGYRFYDDAALMRMQEILFYRELDFPLKQICEILSSPDYDKREALAKQKILLLLKKQRLENMISAIDQAQKGDIIMNAFDNNKYESVRQVYEDEAKERWGQTEAYREHSRKTEHYSKETWEQMNAGLWEVFAAFAACMQEEKEPDSEQAQRLVKRLQGYITAHYYTCTDPILAGLGQMYTADERFRSNIDRYGSGTAEYVSRAIQIYCT